MKLEDKIAQALTWIEFGNDFVGYARAHEYENAMDAASAFNACYTAYLELSDQKEMLITLVRHFDSV